MIALLVIDMQNDCFEDPALAEQRALVAACNELLAGFGYMLRILSAEYRQQVQSNAEILKRPGSP